jgi:hypothetical protein
MVDHTDESQSSVTSVAMNTQGSARSQSSLRGAFSLLHQIGQEAQSLVEVSISEPGGSGNACAVIFRRAKPQRELARGLRWVALNLW